MAVVDVGPRVRRASRVIPKTVSYQRREALEVASGEPHVVDAIGGEHGASLIDGSRHR